jgi:K+-sensing histidine kinase KdpD
MPIWQHRISSFRLLDWAPDCLLALVCGAVATAAEFALSSLIGPNVPFAAYFPAVVAAALLGGAVAGTLTVLIAVVVVWWAFIPPYYEFSTLDRIQSANVALFVLSAFATVWIAYRYRQAARESTEHD